MPTKAATLSEGARGPDYDAPETLVVSESGQLRALADDVRVGIVSLLRERAFSTQQLAEKLEIPKGTAGHHVKVLEHAGLIRVVRRRKVRAVTEKFYGRSAHLFLFQVEDPSDARALGGSVLRRAANEVERAGDVRGMGHPKARLLRKDVDRLERRLKKLADDFLAADDPDGSPYAMVAALYERPDA